jgi:hypothetical protein
MLGKIALRDKGFQDKGFGIARRRGCCGAATA